MPGPTLLQIRRTSVADREANTITLPDAGTLALNILDGRAFSTNGAVVFEIGANTKNCRVSNSFFVGDTTVNVFANSTIIQVANSTVNTHLAVPTSGQYSATNYFLHANGSWVQVTGGGGSVRVYQSYTATGGQTTYTVSGGYTIGQIEVFENGVHLANTEYTENGSTVVLSTGSLAGAIIEVSGWINMGSFSPVASGSNTWVQFNDSTAIGGSGGFTFDKATNNAVIANTLTVGTATINSTKYSQTANNADYLGGTVAASYQLNSTLAANVAILDANTAKFLVGANVISNTTGLYPLSNTSGDEFGNTIARWVITANSIALTGQLANSLGFYPTSNTVGQLFGNTIARWDITGNSSTLSGGLTAGGTTVVNSSMVSVTAGSIISANVQTNPQSGTTYTLQATDSGKAVICSSASAVTVTIPAGLPIGFRCQVVQTGAGQVTMSNTGQTGALLFSRTAAFAITAQYGSACVFEATANNYIIDGLI